MREASFCLVKRMNAPILLDLSIPAKSTTQNLTVVGFEVIDMILSLSMPYPDALSVAIDLLDIS
jgi:hypothetical protein